MRFMPTFAIGLTPLMSAHKIETIEIFLLNRQVNFLIVDFNRFNLPIPSARRNK